jgi:sugar/nucleoside kinase (ribokinase family)
VGPKGLFVGLTTVDVQYLVVTFPQPDAKTVAAGFSMTAGGPATNAAITFAYLGGQGHLLAAVGQSPFTPLIVAELQRYGVALTDLTPAATALPTISSIVTTAGTGSRAVITTRRAAPSPPPSVGALPELDGCAVVLVDGFQMEACRVVARAARERGIPVVLDGGSWKDGMETLLPSVDIAICSEDFHTPAGGEPEQVFRFLAEHGVPYRAITRGARPIRYSTPRDAGEIAIAAVRVVDTLGAGDILHGAFCHAYASGSDFRTALAQAAQVATRSTQSFGTRAWMNETGG